MTADDILVGAISISFGIAEVVTHLHAWRTSEIPCTTVFGVRIPEGTPVEVQTHEYVHKVTLAAHIRILIMSFGWIVPKAYLGFPPMASLIVALAFSILFISANEMIADSVCVLVYGRKRYFRTLARVHIQFGFGYLRNTTILKQFVLYPHRIPLMRRIVARAASRKAKREEIGKIIAGNISGKGGHYEPKRRHMRQVREKARGI